MDKRQLTKKQLPVFCWVVAFKEEHIVWPTWQDVADHFGWKSPSTFDPYIKAFIEKDYMSKDQHGEYHLTGRGRRLFETWQSKNHPVEG